MSSEIKRIAMWSGPRNISTAMMRAFGNRADTWVVDEPLYAHYLRDTGFAHPMAAEIIADGEPEWRAVAETLTTSTSGARRVHYQKHMAHHLLPGVGREWLDGLVHAFLIRSPGEMITSLVKKLGPVVLEDTGLPQQVEIFRRVRQARGGVPPVVDAKDVLGDPEGMLRKLCDALELAFEPSMLSWPPGLRDTDGVWATHWYDQVAKTTGFQPYRPKDDVVPPELESIVATCDELYQELWAHRLR